MNWDTVFETAETVTAEETRIFMESGEADRYQLLDVRQPKEYERAHIPGALLIPLASLTARHGDLNPDKPTIVYCRSGVRSKAACQILMQLGIKHVFNMSGGFVKWRGEHAAGDVEAGLDYFVGGNFATSFEMAVQMESGLKQFYRTLAERAATKEANEVLDRLARLEDGHIARLEATYGETAGTTVPAVVEGGFDRDDMLRTFSEQLGDTQEILQLAMKLEAQAFDLYTRLAWKHQGSETASFYLDMANEEQDHLVRLAAELDALLETE